jgi:hypothetical protein
MGISFLWHMEEAGTAIGGRVNVALVTNFIVPCQYRLRSFFSRHSLIIFSFSLSSESDSYFSLSPLDYTSDASPVDIPVFRSIEISRLSFCPSIPSCFWPYILSGTERTLLNQLQKRWQSTKSCGKLQNWTKCIEKFIPL